MLATYLGNFALFRLGNAVMGASNAFALHLRFAAAEAADDAFRPKAISLVLAGGIVAAIVGPSAAEIAGPQRALLEIARQPTFIAALLAAGFGYGTMSFVMTATPLAMLACGFVVADVATVISWHILGMFAPSFVTGHIIRRIGERNVLLLGVGRYAVTIGIALAGINIVNFWVALVSLGLGWNLLYVGGTSLLTKCYRPSERAKVQGFNDFLTFSGVAACSLIVGAIEQTLGWDVVLYGALAPTLIIVVAVMWGAPRHGAPAARSPVKATAPSE